MPVYYSLISRGKVVVCDHSSSGISLEAVSLEALDNLGPSDIKRCQSTGDFLIFTFVDDSLTYLCVTDLNFSGVSYMLFVHNYVFDVVVCNTIIIIIIVV